MATQNVEQVKATRYEKFMLPSKGKFYPADWTENGLISIRPMTVEEEMILTTARHVKRGVALDMIFAACLENKSIDTKELLSGDRSFLLYNLRCISYGAAYDFEIKCPSCGFKIKDTFNLNNVKTKELLDSDFEPIEFKLPISKKTVKFRYMRGKDEAKLISNREYRLNAFGQDSIDNTLLERLALTTIEIDGVADKLKIELELKSMIAGDAAALREKMLSCEPGVETET